MAARDGAAPSRLVTAGGGAIAAAGIAVAIALYRAQFTTIEWIMTAAGAVAICYVATNALPIRGLRMKRTGLNAETVVLDLSIAAPLFALGGTTGATAVVIALAAGYACAAIFAKSKAPTDLLRHGVTRTLAALLLLPFIANFAFLNGMPEPLGSIAFAAIVIIGDAIFVLTISAPLSAYTYHISLSRVWARVLSDPRTWIVGIGNVIWATVVRDPMVSGHFYEAMALWLPVAVVALLLKTIDEQHAELHRLRLVQDAVQAMLGDRDPLPQINAILATLRVPAFDETVAVLAATGARTDTWRTVTTLGPALSSAGDELGRRILARLKFSGRASTTLRDEFYIAYAFAARLSDSDLHGAMVVYRRSDRPLTGEQIAQFTNAATELAPLLRDMRSIAAAQSAATTDGLTTLFNRSTTMDRLQGMLDDITAISGHGAVLLLDIDHFKVINDQLGHAAGDECLRKIGDIIRNTVRSGDTAGRIGGEEFLIVMPGATRDIAMTVGERLRLAVSLGGMRYASGDPVTTSIGVAAAIAGDTAENLLARADRALYEAKRQGRNRIVEEEESA